MGKNAPVSTEITGYAASALTYLHALTGEAAYLEAARRAALYLTRDAWDPVSATFPFEPASGQAYFFDIGIIIRGLLAVWRATGEEQFRERARQASLSLAFDFLGDEGFHSAIHLPDKQPLPYEPRWSRRPGCYQLKSALAWRDIAAACGEPDAARLFEAALARLIVGHEAFLDGEVDQEKLMDRLHAYCYFLEALLAAADREPVRVALAQGVGRAAELFREIAPRFERSDVSAQLLRVRLIAHHHGALVLDEQAARQEAERTHAFQILSGPNAADPRCRGGLYFGCKGGEMLPFVNPVSTAFALQALRLWNEHQAGRWSFELAQLI